MYSTLVYLAFILSYRTLDKGNYLARLEQCIILFLTYVMVLLTDYVEDSVHFESISRCFLYGSYTLIGVSVSPPLF